MRCLSLQRSPVGRVVKVGLGLALVVLLPAAMGCGGGGDTASGEPAQDPLASYPKGPTREFYIPGGDNAVQLFGHEATPRERRQASVTLNRWMSARADADWVRDCAYMSQRLKRELAIDASERSRKHQNCPGALAFFGSQASGDLVDSTTGPIDSLRAEAGRGYAQYHGRHGTDWIVPMVREEGNWWVSAAAPLERQQ